MPLRPIRLPKRGAAGEAASRQPRTEAVAPSGDLTAEAMGQSLCMLMPDNAILVVEAATNGPRSSRR
jgi:hypothetical protein